MLVCHCHAVSDRVVREAVRCGARSVSAVGEACGAGTGCGGCHEVVEEIVASEAPRPLVTIRLAGAMAEAG